MALRSHQRDDDVQPLVYRIVDHPIEFFDRIDGHIVIGGDAA